MRQSEIALLRAGGGTPVVSNFKIERTAKNTRDPQGIRAEIGLDRPVWRAGLRPELQERGLALLGRVCRFAAYGAVLLPQKAWAEQGIGGLSAEKLQACTGLTLEEAADTDRAAACVKACFGALGTAADHAVHFRNWTQITLWATFAVAVIAVAVLQPLVAAKAGRSGWRQGKRWSTQLVVLAGAVLVAGLAGFGAYSAWAKPHGINMYMDLMTMQSTGVLSPDSKTMTCNGKIIFDRTWEDGAILNSFKNYRGVIRPMILHTKEIGTSLSLGHPDAKVVYDDMMKTMEETNKIDLKTTPLTADPPTDKGPINAVRDALGFPWNFPLSAVFGALVGAAMGIAVQGLRRPRAT